jgi:hypothetical protein
MGMESFFIIILPEGISHTKNEYGINVYKGESSITYNRLKEIFDEIDGIIYIDSLKLYCHISNRFLLKPFFDDEKLLYISLEACLWYLENNTNEIISLLNIFSKGFNAFHPGICYVNNTFIDFVKNVSFFYKEKIDDFINKYSEYFATEDILPGDYFYKKIKARSVRKIENP